MEIYDFQFNKTILLFPLYVRTNYSTWLQKNFLKFDSNLNDKWMLLDLKLLYLFVMTRQFSVALGVEEHLRTSTPTSIRPTTTTAVKACLFLPRDESRIAFLSVTILSAALQVRRN